MLWLLERECSSEYPKQMLKLMDKKIFTILHSDIWVISTWVCKKKECTIDVLLYKISIAQHLRSFSLSMLLDDK